MPLTDLDDRVPRPVDEPWVQIPTDAKDEVEVDDFAAVPWLKVLNPLDISNVDITDGMLARAARPAQDACMSDERANQILAALPKGKRFILRIKFLREKASGGWFVEDNFDPVREKAKKGQAIVEISRDTKPGALTGIDGVFYQNAYPYLAVAYGPNPLRNPDPANPAPMRSGDLNCVAQRVVENFERTLRDQGLTPTR